MSVDEDNQRKDEHISYTYTSSSGEHVLNLTRRPTFYRLINRSLFYDYELTIDGYVSQCGMMPPTDPRTDIPAYFGQTFFSTAFIINLVRAGIEKNALDLFISRATWPN